MLYGEWPNKTRMKASYSAFLFAADDQWHLSTAGHNIANWREAIENGLDVQGCDLNDAFAGGPHLRTVPIDLRADDWLMLFDPQDPSGLDLAATRLAPFHRRALSANGIVPLDLGADFLRLSQTPCTCLYLTGIPEETTRVFDHSLKQNLYVIPAFGIAEASVSPALRHPLKRHYGTLSELGWTSAGLQSISGMSGGPVFGLWMDEANDSFDYTAIGIQSGWDASAKQIAATSLDALSRAIAEMFPG